MAEKNPVIADMQKLNFTKSDSVTHQKHKSLSFAKRNANCDEQTLRKSAIEFDQVTFLDRKDFIPVVAIFGDDRFSFRLTKVENYHLSQDWVSIKSQVFCGNCFEEPTEKKNNTILNETVIL